MPRAACALTIAGLDPGGGAGIAADLRAFAAAGAFGAAVVVLHTVQSTRGLSGVTCFAPKAWRPAADEVLAAQRVRALKTGALGTIENVREVLRLFDAHPRLPRVVDPVMVATRGASPLLQAKAVGAMRDLACRATLLTPNADEAAALLGRAVDAKGAEEAAKALVGLGAKAVLLKGGHFAGGDEVVDWFAEKTGTRGAVRTKALRRPRVPRLRLHGGGCTLASLVAGRLAAEGDAVEDAVTWAAEVLAEAIRGALDVGGPLRVVDPTR